MARIVSRLQNNVRIWLPKQVCFQFSSECWQWWSSSNIVRKIVSESRTSWSKRAFSDGCKTWRTDHELTGWRRPKESVTLWSVRLKYWRVTVWSIGGGEAASIKSARPVASLTAEPWLRRLVQPPSGEQHHENVLEKQSTPFCLLKPTPPANLQRTVFCCKSSKVVKPYSLNPLWRYKMLSLSDVLTAATWSLVELRELGQNI